MLLALLSWTGMSNIDNLRLLYSIASGLWAFTLILFTRLWWLGLLHERLRSPLLLGGIISSLIGASTTFAVCYVVWFQIGDANHRQTVAELLPIGTIAAALSHAAVTLAITRGRLRG